MIGAFLTEFSHWMSWVSVIRNEDSLGSVKIEPTTSGVNHQFRNELFQSWIVAISTTLCKMASFYLTPHTSQIMHIEEEGFLLFYLSMKSLEVLRQKWIYYLKGRQERILMHCTGFRDPFRCELFNSVKLLLKNEYVAILLNYGILFYQNVKLNFQK